MCQWYMLKELDGQLSMGRSTCNYTLDRGEVRLLVFQKPAKEGVPFMMSSHFLLNGIRKKKKTLDSNLVL